jgi:hypothetical protein
VSTTRQFNGIDSTAAQHYRTAGAADGQAPPSPANRGSPEGRFLVSAGKPLSRLITELKDRWAAALVRVKGAAAALDHAADAARERKAHHRGGDRPWPLRLIIPVAVAAEALTAFVAMEALVSTVGLAFGLSVMTALVGTGTACMIANRRLNGLPVPIWARVVEAAFVGILTLLRYVSLDVQSSDPTAALGGAALAALISAVALLAIEEAVVETDTFSVFVSRLRVWLRRWQWSRAEARVASGQAKLEATGEKFQQHFLDFLLKVEGFSLDDALPRARALKAAMFQAEGDSS